MIGNRGTAAVVLAGLSLIVAGGIVPGVSLPAAAATTQPAQPAQAAATLPVAARGAVEAALMKADAVAPPSVLRQTELTSTDPSGVALFGSSVAVLGDTLVIGAKGRVGSGVNEGAVFVFSKPASGWAHAHQVAELYATDGAPEDELGFEVAMTADTIVATAQYKKVGSHVDQGAVYVWNKPVSGWTSNSNNAELVAGDGATGDELDAVAMTENTIVAGAFSHKVGSAADEGAAYVFTKPVGGWQDTSTSLELTDPGGAAGDEFGLSVATAGNTVYVGAPRTVVTALPQGVVYAYTSASGSWNSVPPHAALFASDGAEGDEFGSSVEVSGNTLVAGAPERTVDTHSVQGAAYVFVEPAGGWPILDAQQAELTQADGQPNEQFGGFVAVAGNQVVVGAPQHDNAGIKAGAAYIFPEPAGGWADESERASLTPHDGAASDLFGYRIAMDGSAIFVGAELHQTPTEQGAEYAFAVPTPAVTAVKQSHAAWRAGRHAAVVNPKHHLAGGTMLSFRLNDVATVSLRFGRHVGAALKPRGVLTVAAKTGLTRIYFDGVVSPTRTLTPGRYTLTLSATSSGGTATLHRLVFTIRKPKRRK